MSTAADQTAAAATVAALPAGARCAVHAGAEASTVCARCGDFACGLCEAKVDDERFCATCLDHIAPLADPGRRLLAHIIDSYLLTTVPGLLALCSVVLSNDTAALVLGGLGIAGIVLVAVLQVRSVHRHGQSIAKRWLKLRVVHTDGRRMSLSRIIFARNLLPGVLGFVPIVGGMFSLADALFVFGEQRRTLHDRMADSIVISVRSAAGRR